MDKEPPSRPKEESRGEIVAHDSSAHLETSTTTPERRRVFGPLACFALTVLLFVVGGYFMLWQTEKSAWDAEQAALKPLLNIRGLSFMSDQVLPEWLFGKYGRRIVRVNYDRWRMVPGAGVALSQAWQCTELGDVTRLRHQELQRPQKVGL